MSESSPLVSIIIPCYNAEPWIGECLDSAIAQTYRPLEIIVIDDGSTDGSLDVIKRYAQQHPDLIQYETGPNRGGCAARNRGFALSKGEYVMFLDADDVISANAIEEHMKVQLRDGTKKNISVSEWRRVRDLSPGWEIIPGSGPQCRIGEDDLNNIFAFGNYPLHAILYPREVMIAIGPWDERLFRGQDVDLLIRALLYVDRVIPIANVLAYYRYHSGHLNGTATSSVSKRKAAESAKYIAEKLEELLSNASLFDKYRLYVGRAYFNAAGSFFSIADNVTGRKLEHKAYQVAGHRVTQGSFIHRSLVIIIGIRRKEQLARFLAKYGIANRIRRANMRAEKRMPS